LLFYATLACSARGYDALCLPQSVTQDISHSPVFSVWREEVLPATTDEVTTWFPRST